jgi:tetratricopeptide (TPR) repeat protein
MKRISCFTKFKPTYLSLVLTVAVLLLQPAFVPAQTPSNAERERAFQLYDENKFVDALPLLEKLANANPSDVVVLSRFGFALYASTATIQDPNARKLVRTRARNVLERAQALGDNSVLTRVTIDALTSNESGEFSYSQLQEADRAMREGEASFARGDFKAALAAYDRALAADPKLYEAALYKGDVYFKSDEQEKAGEWFARAVKINPDRETAYRYWGDSLMKQGKTEAAREKFIEAFIAEPYSRLAANGFVQWADANNVKLAHPKIDIPANVTPLKDGQTTINLDPSMMKDEANDGTAAWIVYGLVRASWATSEFAKQSDEKPYRHTLKEEAAALRSVVKSVKEQQNAKKIKQLTPSLAMLLKVETDGLLEPYILMARADQGIAQDFSAYRRSNIDKLRQYVVQYVLIGQD